MFFLYCLLNQDCEYNICANKNPEQITLSGTKKKICILIIPLILPLFAAKTLFLSFIIIWNRKKQSILCPVELWTQCVRNWIHTIELPTKLQLTIRKACTILRLKLLSQILNKIWAVFSTLFTLLLGLKDPLANIPIHLHSTEEKGQLEEKLKIARSMKVKNIDSATIVQCTNLTIEQVEAL